MFMLKTSTSFQHQTIDKTKFLALIKPLMNSRTKGSKRKKQKQQNAIIIHDHNNKETIKNVEDYHYHNKLYFKNVEDYHYQKKKLHSFIKRKKIVI